MGRRISKLKFQIPTLGFQISNCQRSDAGYQASDHELARPSSQIPNCERRRGFSLIELMVVLFILLILATMSIPIFTSAIVHAREAVLKDDLYTLRKLIDEYTLDKQKPPTSLSDLVDAGYLRAGVPVDPFTGSSDTWQTDTEEVPTSPSQAASGIVNVHSGSDGTALDGTAYSSW
jgi:general secretion pathway protein G